MLRNDVQVCEFISTERKRQSKVSFILSLYHTHFLFIHKPSSFLSTSSILFPHFLFNFLLVLHHLLFHSLTSFPHFSFFITPLLSSPHLPIHQPFFLHSFFSTLPSTHLFLLSLLPSYLSPLSSSLSFHSSLCPYLSSLTTPLSVPFPLLFSSLPSSLSPSLLSLPLFPPLLPLLFPLFPLSPTPSPVCRCSRECAEDGGGDTVWTAVREMKREKEKRDGKMMEREGEKEKRREMT